MEEKYRDFSIRELSEPEQLCSWLFAGSYLKNVPCFTSEPYPNDEGIEALNRSREKALDEIKKKIDTYHEEKHLYREIHGHIVVRIPIKEWAKDIDGAAQRARNDLEERLIAAVELLDYIED